MNYDNSSRITIFLFLTAFSFRAFSAEAISPEQATSYALEHSPVLQSTASGVRAQNELVTTAKAEKLPVIDLDYGMIYSDNPLVSLGSKLNNRSITSEDFSPETINDPGFSDNYFGNLRLKLPLYTGGKISAGIDEANATHASSLAQHRRTTSTVIYQTKRAYLLAQAAHEAIIIARRSTEAAAQHVNTTRELLLENRTVASDNITAKVYHRSVKGVISQAETQYEQALNALKQVMGMNLSTEISIVPWESASETTGLQDITKAESLALKSRHDLDASDKNIAAAEARTRIASSASRVQLGLEASSSLYADDPLVDELSWGVLAVAKINLYSGGANKSRINAAREETLRLQSEKESKELEIRKQVRNAYASINEGETRIKLARQNLSDAKKAVALVNERYGEGRTILIDLLQSEQSLMKSRSESLNSRLLLEASRLELQLAMDDFAEAKI